MIRKIYSRRQFLGAGFVLGTGLALGLPSLAQESTAEATEEAIINSLLKATPMRSSQGEVEALDADVVRRYVSKKN